MPRLDLRTVGTVLLDMDGTLVDSDAPVERVRTTWAREYGVPAEAVLAHTPMPWRPGQGLGFTTERPWLPEGGRTEADTVEGQAGDPASHLNAVIRLPAARHGQALLPAAL
ncbi:hypothetical protein ACWDTT_16470 [Streptosporangium sandarakinum]